MIHPVKVYDKDGKLKYQLTTDELIALRESEYAKQKDTTYRARFDAMVNAKKQAPGKVAPGKGDAIPETERPRNPVQPGGNRGLDDGKRTKILANTPSIFKELKENLDKLRNFIK
jgi:hypothetical protein